jgi:hypothetical protein
MAMERIALESADQLLPKWEKCEDRTLYWTLSFYIDRRVLPEPVIDSLRPARKLEVQSGYLESGRLRDAMEPLFNDIADRERLSQVDDYLLRVPDAPRGQWIEISIPDIVTWATEGTRFRAHLGTFPKRMLRCRCFWYVHLNGSLSYHASFSLKYQHTPADFYLISLLQKVIAPKEFAIPGPLPAEPVSVFDQRAKVFPLQNVAVRTLSSERGWSETVPFWEFIRSTFDRHAGHLFQHFGALPRGTNSKGYFETLVENDEFIEVPRLKVPRARLLFLFDDKTFFRDLLPERTPDGRRATRRDFVSDAKYDRFKAWIHTQIEAANQSAAAGDKSPVVDITTSYLNDVAHSFPEGLRYLFLAGFNQNIIDFMNQDASEILDSTDPIYPSTPEQEDESFFVRFANPRALIQFVPGSRSLEIGDDYIGTCPYAFLIHAIALHNECLVRDYEEETEELTRALRSLSARHHIGRAAQKFYDFRTRQFTDYKKFKYSNIFRYDTEADVFAEVERRRGIHRKDQYLESIVSNLEAQTRDLEGRLRSSEDRQLSYLVGGVGVFAVLQVLFQILDYFTDSEKGRMIPKVLFGLDFSQPANVERAGTALIYTTALLLGVLALVFVYLLLRRIVDRMRG